MNEKKAYVGNLEYSVTDADLKQAVTDKGLTAKEVVVIKDKFSGRSRGFGFISFDTEDQLQAAISALDGYDLKGRKLRVSAAREKQPK